MKRLLLLWGLLVSAGCYAQTEPALPSSARTTSFDTDWLFLKDSTVHAEQVAYDDARWRRVDLPHDWSIEDLPGQTADSIVGPFSKGAVSRLATGFTIGGTVWYRKHFKLGKSSSSKNIFIQFDGIYMNADVWINGHHLGNHPYGYTPFQYELTPFLKPAGQANVIAVRVKNNGRNSRWYSGSGIYRHVSLTMVNPLHIVAWGTHITTPSVSSESAKVSVDTRVKYRSGKEPFTLITAVYSPSGKLVGTGEKTVTSSADSLYDIVQNINIPHPQLWSIETPHLYKALTKVIKSGKVVDQTTTSFGIRTIQFDTEAGFRLNGKRTLLKGGCIHHDNGPLGAAAIDRAEERKVELLKKNGFNAIRLSHNPPSKELLDACDRLGMLVINEAFDMWERSKNPQDYHLYFKDWWQRDLEAMLLRDRNHPSIIMWSIGNEIKERADSSGVRIAKMLRDEVLRLDDTRPVTAAICSFWDNPGTQWDASAPAFASLDVGGYNYLWREYEKDHQVFPGRIMLGTESYPKDALQNWNLVEKHPYVIGDFVWTAMDYLGEASIGHAVLRNKPKFGIFLDWPWFNAWCGDIDLIGNKKPQSYYRDVVWRRIPIAMAVHTPIPEGMKESVSPWGWPDEWQRWTWPGMEGKPLQVRIFSRAPLVRLYLNGKPVGEQNMAANSITAVFKVPYQPGTLRAVSVVDGKETDIVELKTTGKAKHIRLTPDRRSIHASRNDLSYVMVEVVDESGNVVPNADIPVQFSLKGAGEILAVGSADPKDVSSFKKPEKKTFQGKCLVIVRPTGNAGTISLTAIGDGLPTAQTTIKAIKLKESDQSKREK